MANKISCMFTSRRPKWIVSMVSLVGWLLSFFTFYVSLLGNWMYE
jgi:hypothetical protein